MVSVAGTAFRVGLQLAIGAVIGAVIGAIFTGDPTYTVVWAIGLPVILTVAGIAGSRTVRRKLPTVASRLPTGIISTTSPRPVQTAAVLNPESTAVPATGMTLNGAPVAPPPVARARRETVPWWSRALAILIILTGAALVMIPAYRLIGWTATNIAQGRWDGNDMRTGLHQQEAIDDIAAVVGGYDFAAVYFYDSYVLVEAPTRPGATTTDLYQWRYGRAFQDGPRSGSIDGLFDASGIDFSVVADLVARSRADVRWGPVEAYYPSLRANSEGIPEISIWLSNDYYSASYTYDLRGELLDSYTSG